MSNKLLTVILALALSISSGLRQPANATEFENLGLTVTWDEGAFYQPSGCTSYTFGFLKSSERVIAMIRIENQFGDILGADAIYSGNPLSGTRSMIICSGKDFSNTKLVLDVRSPQNGVKSTPILFKVRQTTPTESVPATAQATAPATASTPAAAPATSEVQSKFKIIVCKKNNSTLRVSGKNPKCPSGYKVKK